MPLRSTRQREPWGVTPLLLALVIAEPDVRPLLDRYCVGCHGLEKTKGDVDLRRAAVAKDPNLWRTVLRQLESEEMPPQDPTPTPDERQRLIRWVREALEAVEAAPIRSAGHVTIPRLTREEYNNSMRDLLGLDIRPGDDEESR